MADAKADGRHLRRENNIKAVLDAVLAMFEEELLVPTIEMASERSGLSLRSVYRYFPDPESLLEAAIDETWQRGVTAGHLTRIGEGPFEGRLVDFAGVRVRMYEEVGNSFRAARHHAPKFVRVRENLQHTRQTLTEQFERQFRTEIDALPTGVRVARSINADVMSQFDAIDLLRRYRRLTAAESVDVVAESIRTALTSPS